MELCLYTDSVGEQSLDAALDLAAEVGATAVELAAGGQSSAPHLRLQELLAARGRRTDLAAKLDARGLRIGALNCSAWPLHPRVGEAHVEIIRSTLRLAGELGIEKVVTMSGCPGDSPSSATVNWLTYPWPPDTVAVREEQWERVLALWGRLVD